MAYSGRGASQKRNLFGKPNPNRPFAKNRSDSGKSVEPACQEPFGRSTMKT
jgi:hypothetical protein